MRKREWERTVNKWKKLDSSNRSGLEKYQQLIFAATMEHVLPWKKNDLMKIFVDSQIMAEGGDRLFKIKLKRDGLFVQRLSQGFQEIYNTYESLCDIRIYIRSFPYRNTRVSKNRHLSYCIVTFFHEIYILRLRLEAYLTRFERMNRNSKNIDAIKDVNNILREGIVKAFEGMTSKRGYHVHDKRVSIMENNWLTQLEMVAKLSKDEEDKRKFLKMFENDYKIVRKRWAKQIDEAIKGLKKFLDTYFEALSQIVFDNNNSVKLPKTKKISNG